MGVVEAFAAILVSGVRTAAGGGGAGCNIMNDSRM